MFDLQRRLSILRALGLDILRAAGQCDNHALASLTHCDTDTNVERRLQQRIAKPLEELAIDFALDPGTAKRIGGW